MFTTHFYGQEISNYGKENGRVDYRAFAGAFDAVLNNNIMSQTYDIGYWEQESGFIDNSDDLENQQDEQPEVFQWYIISDQGAEICREYNEILYYNEALDMYLWGVTHYGTSWDYVLTDIPCEKLEK